MSSDPPRKIDPESLAAGDLAAFEILYARLARPMLRVAAAMLGNAGDAEDAVHDVFVALARGRERLRQVEDIDAYVFASLRHGVVARAQRRRAERRHLQRILAAPADFAGATHAPDSEELVLALASLPPEQREIVVLKIDANLTFAQIGQVLAISPNTAASRYRYAIDKLRRTLGDRS